MSFTVTPFHYAPVRTATMANIAFIGVVQGASEGVDLILGLEERTPHSVTVAVTNYNTKASIATCLLLPHEQ